MSLVGIPSTVHFQFHICVFHFLTTESYHRYVAARFELEWEGTSKEKVKLCLVPHKVEEASERVSLRNFSSVSVNLQNKRHF